MIKLKSEVRIARNIIFFSFSQTHPMGICLYFEWDEFHVYEIVSVVAPGSSLIQPGHAGLHAFGPQCTICPAALSLHPVPQVQRHGWNRGQTSLLWVSLPKKNIALLNKNLDQNVKIMLTLLGGCITLLLWTLGKMLVTS